MISIFDLFTIGIGPSSSHTVGPMRATRDFLDNLHAKNLFASCHRVTVHLYGSLALTGKGHGTDKAIIIGLEGYDAQTVQTDWVPIRYTEIVQSHTLNLDQKKSIRFTLDKNLEFHFTEVLPEHTNGMRLEALDKDKKIIFSETYYSIGGGFIATDDSIKANQPHNPDQYQVPYPFSTAKQLLEYCKQEQASISDIVLANELEKLSKDQIQENAEKIWQAMDTSINKGCLTPGVLPGGLQVKRRAPDLYTKLKNLDPDGTNSAYRMGWLNTFAMAVNEENAAMGRVVTAPTNGAAGIIPAVFKYYLQIHPNYTPTDILRYLLTCGGIGILYKAQASISGAEVGCQGEVGVACSMAAAGFTELLGGNVWQVENAAEIAMEHHLGLTCDPIDGLVQIPCIERNAMAAVRAVNVGELSLLEEGEHKVSLDKVIATMRQTGKDMMTIYKETSEGGLAVNHPEC